SGFVDCGFVCNREALEKIDFKLNAIPKERFEDPHKSSGVGKQMSFKFLNKGVMMFKPIHSLCKQQEESFDSK
ncbi:MAG: hypothetical protein GWN01_07535, partial [Nitrosopumilaceae archaeon]|nr:hypothetical protein [Nitrosopumilaceae archaeon]NIX61374.1 hypothetical protein [Nitrosopumilaceae archaeon]